MSVKDGLYHEVDGNLYCYSQFEYDGGIDVVVIGGYDRLSGKPYPMGSAHHMQRRNSNAWYTGIAKWANGTQKKINGRLTPTQMVEEIVRFVKG